MQLNDILYISIRQIFRNRRRYLGVVLTIAMGVTGIISIVTMTKEVKKYFNEDLEIIGGATIIPIYFDNIRPYKLQWFREGTVAALRRVPGVKVVSLTAVKGGKTHWHGEQNDIVIHAVDESFWEVRNLWSINGQLFGYESLKKRTRECVLGVELAKKIFGSELAIGQIIEINYENYSVSGIIGGVMVDRGLDYAAFLPLTTAQDRFPGTLIADRLFLRCHTWDDVVQVAAAIQAIIEANQSTQKLHVDVNWGVLRRVQLLAWWVEFLVYLSVMTTFILGGVGIWNVMMAAVTSRTREIGLKKAMGAEDRDILSQFLSEAICISLAGTLIGAIVGRIVILSLASIMRSHPPEHLFLMGLCLGLLFAIILGIGAGLYPSFRASRMEVVCAIRYE